MNPVVFGLVVVSFSITLAVVFSRMKMKEQRDDYKSKYETSERKYNSLNQEFMFLFNQIYDSLYEENDEAYTVRFKVKEKLRDLVVAKDSVVRVPFKEVSN